jgi:predicted AAA+ superfamily ATPase
MKNRQKLLQRRKTHVCEEILYPIVSKTDLNILLLKAIPVFTGDRFVWKVVPMNDRIRESIREKLGDAVELPFPQLTPREATTTVLEGKARAIIGMRRAGKTTFLYQCLAARLAEGVARERLVYFNFEDERLGDLEAADLGVILDEYYRAYPEFRRRERVTWCFDEIQVITGWEKFVRRVMDTENVEVLLSGSSARMLSREVATTMRGRALETIITPFSFREFVRARGGALPTKKGLMSATEQSAWLSYLDDFIEIGGFPEAGKESLRSQRVNLLQGYVDTVLFRDVAERHGIANIVALRAFVRQLLRQSASPFSVSKVHADFRSRGISISKETLLELLAHLEDAFLLFTVPIASRSERRQQVNPRKLYLADHGLAVAYNPVSGTDRGRYLENIVACELLRQNMNLAYVKTVHGHEVDFLASSADGSTQLIQVAAEIENVATFEREIRALQGAAAEFPAARKVLIAEGTPPRGKAVPEGIELLPIWRWLLDPQMTAK